MAKDKLLLSFDWAKNVDFVKELFPLNDLAVQVCMKMTKTSYNLQYLRYDKTKTTKSLEEILLQRYRSALCK